MGIEVSVGEHLDAASAVSQISLQDKEVLRAALQATLIKHAQHLATFNLLFELYTAGGARPGAAPLSGLSDEELRDALRAAIGSDEDALRALLADEYVRRFSGAEPGRAVAGVMYTIAVNEAADLAGLRAELLPDSQGGGGGAAAGEVAEAAMGKARAAGPGSRRSPPSVAGVRQAEVDRALDRFRAELQSAVRRTLVADRGAQAVRATMRVGLAEDTDIASASGAELEAMSAAIGPLVQRLTQVLSARPSTASASSASAAPCSGRWAAAASRSGWSPSRSGRRSRTSWCSATCPGRCPRSPGSPWTC